MIGKLRHRLTLQAESAITDAGGGQVLAWQDLATFWGRVEPLSGLERLRAQQLEDRVSHKVTIRYRAGVTAKHRLRFGARSFNIRAVLDPEERGRWLELLCEEGVAT